jgi:hypothetical protein
MPLSAPSPIRPTLMFAAIALHGSVKTLLLSLMLHGPSLTPHSLATLPPTNLIPTCTHVLVDPNICRRKAASSRVSAEPESPPTSLVLASMAPSPLLEHHRSGTHSPTNSLNSCTGYTLFLLGALLLLDTCTCTLDTCTVARRQHMNY